MPSGCRICDLVRVKMLRSLGFEEGGLSFAGFTQDGNEGRDEI
jgi:hypothetical protein